MDCTVRGNQGKALDKCGGSDDAIRWIFGIVSWKSEGTRPSLGADARNDKPRLEFLQERFEADAEVDAAPVRRDRTCE
jgi:hypothetical protein